MNWFEGLSTAVVLAYFGYLLKRLQRKSEKRDEQDEAVSALRFELQSNLGYLGDIIESRNYLRDEAWVALKSKGYISYLHAPIPMKVIAVYDKLHRLNEQIHVLKKSSQNTPTDKIAQDRTALEAIIIELIRVLDEKYQNIGKNYKDEHSA